MSLGSNGILQSVGAENKCESKGKEYQDMKGKRFLALALSTAMVLGCSATAFAADKSGAGEGSGEVQYLAEDDIFDVVLPTDAGTAFDYLLDPNGLIAATGGDRYSGKIFDDGKTVYFLHAAKVDGTVGGTAGTANCDYTATSDEIKVTNKSTEAVDLTVTAKIAEADGVKMDADGTFATNGGNLYLALVGNDGTNDTTKALTTAGVELQANIAADANAYEVKWDATGDTGKYVKALTTAAQVADYAGFKSYTFKLTGSCKANDDALSALKENPPKIDLTWSVKDFTATDAEPAISSVGEFDKANPVDVVISFSLGTGAKAIEADGVALMFGASKATVLPAKYTADISAGTVSIDKSAGFLVNATADIPIYLSLTKDGTEVKELSGTITIK